MSLLQSASQGLLDLLFPPHCAGCGNYGGWLCQACLASIAYLSPPLCPGCGRPEAVACLCTSCSHTPLQIDGIRSVAYLEGSLQEAIHQLKYANLSAVARPLGEILAHFWQGNPLPADLLVPVPLHPRRERERGYNQASLLAKALGEAIGLPVLEHAMVRVRETRPQVGLNSEERKKNVRGAFRCESTHLAGRHVALIDDVCTTGATLEACSLALRQAGAASIWALTLARPRL